MEVGKYERKRQLETRKHGWEGDIRIDVNEKIVEGVNCVARLGFQPHFYVAVDTDCMWLVAVLMELAKTVC
jgi:hypothetical protein